MFDWTGCPAGLSDLYMEISEVKISSFEAEGCVFAELTVSTTGDEVVRRPIYGILRQLKKFCGSSPLCLVIMSKEEGYDTTDLYSALYVLLKQLKKDGILLHTLLYTKLTQEQFNERISSTDLHKRLNKEEFLEFCEMPDVIVFGKANFLSEKSNIIKARTSAPPLLDAYLEFRK